MNNLLRHWWRRQRLRWALQQGDKDQAEQLLQQTINAKQKLTWWELLFHQKLQQEKQYKNLQSQQTSLELSSQNSTANLNKVVVKESVVNKFFQRLQITQHDQYKRQVTDIDQTVFNEFESELVKYLEQELTKKSTAQAKVQLKQALDDLNNLKRGCDPSYAMAFTPYVYFMKYFLENTYSIYLAWLLIYEQDLLSTKFTLLDIAAGPATTAYGLALFLESLETMQSIPPTHISYFSLEQQKELQYRGLQFWRKYIESKSSPINTYFRFVTEDIRNHQNWSNKAPKKFFDIIFISHCFSSAPTMREEFKIAYQNIIEKHLSDRGFVVLIIQDKKLFKMYNTFPKEDIQNEKMIINGFLSEFNLTLVNYQYLTSTPCRESMKRREFGEFATKNLPEKLWMNSLLKKYLDQNFQAHFTLDDYVILARRSSSK